MQTYLEWSLRENLVWKWVPILYYFYGHLPQKWYCPFWGIITLQFIRSGPFSKKGCFTPSASRIPNTEKKIFINVVCTLYSTLYCIRNQNTFWYIFSSTRTMYILVCTYVQMYNVYMCRCTMHILTVCADVRCIYVQMYNVYMRRCTMNKCADVYNVYMCRCTMYICADVQCILYCICADVQLYTYMYVQMYNVFIDDLYVH